MKTDNPIVTTASHVSAESVAHLHKKVRGNNRQPQLKLIQCLFAFLAFLVWLVLFAGGILIDTKPYRSVLSPGGVAALEAEAVPSTAAAASATPVNTQAPKPPAPAPGLAKSWIVVLLWFLPVNLAWLCAAAATLGSFGSRVNLGDDQTKRTSRDNSNPFISALLRGFFIYLFMISGLLLLDVNPFSNPTPGQYVRLAGFLSLFSFVVNYQPRLFSMLIVWAFNRIQESEGGNATDIHYAKATTYEMATVHTASGQAGDASQLQHRGPDELFLDEKKIHASAEPEREVEPADEGKDET